MEHEDWDNVQNKNNVKVHSDWFRNIFWTKTFWIIGDGLGWWFLSLAPSDAIS